MTLQKWMMITWKIGHFSISTYFFSNWNRSILFWATSSWVSLATISALFIICTFFLVKQIQSTTLLWTKKHVNKMSYWEDERKQKNIYNLYVLCFVQLFFLSKPMSILQYGIWYCCIQQNLLSIPEQSCDFIMLFSNVQNGV